MASLVANNATNIFSDVPSEKAGLGDLGGRVRHLYDQITISAALGAGDTIDLPKLPQNARPIGGWIKSDAMANSCAVKIGNKVSALLDSDGNAVEAADDDSISTAVSISSAGTTRLEATAGAGFGNVLDAEVQLQATVTVAGTATSGTIQFCIEYVVD